MVVAQGSKAMQGVGDSVRAIKDKVTTVIEGMYPLNYLSTLTFLSD